MITFLFFLRTVPGGSQLRDLTRRSMLAGVPLHDLAEPPGRLSDAIAGFAAQEDRGEGVAEAVRRPEGARVPAAPDADPDVLRQLREAVVVQPLREDYLGYSGAEER